MTLILDNGRLCLGNARINPLNQDRLRKSLKKNTTLSQIILLGSTLTDDVVDDLCALIETNSTLGQLQFLKEEFTDAGVSKLLRCLSTNSTLKNLEFWRCKVTDAVVDDLCLLSLRNSTLKVIQFHQATFTDSGLCTVLRSLCGNTHLSHLAFWESPLSDQAIRSLCMLFEKNKVMQDLQFQKAIFTDSGLSQLLQSICTNGTMRQLVFAKSKLSDAVVPLMSSLLEVNKVLKGLKFRQAEFSDAGLSRLLLPLTWNARLQAIIFTESQLTDDLIGDFRSFVEQNHVMTHLQFSEARFTDLGLSTLLKAISMNSVMEILTFRDSQFSDAVIPPMCRFLNGNNVMKDLLFADDRFTDDGASQLLQSLTLNNTLEGFVFGGSSLSDTVVSDLCKFVEDNRVMKDMRIVHPAGDEFIKPLMKFLKYREYIMRVRPVTRGETQCLLTEESYEFDPSYYHITTVNGQVRILPRSEYLQAELVDLLKEHSIPSAVDILNNLLVLFVQKDKEARFKEALAEKMQDVDVNIATAYRIHSLDNQPELIFQNDTEQWKSGLGVYTPDIGDKGLFSTVGVILVDDEGKLYLTSTFHGNKFEKCKVREKYEGECVAEVYNMSPLLDACLIEVQDSMGKTKYSPTLPAPHAEAALCGPYTGPNGDITKNFNPTRGQPRTTATTTTVNKYGITTDLTEGKLLYHNYTDPDLDISDALLVLPDSDKEFTAGGDSGAVIFRHSPCTDTHTDTVFCHQAIAVNCAGVQLGPQKVSIACRLDAVIEHFELKLGKRLKLIGTHAHSLEESIDKTNTATLPQLGKALTQSDDNKTTADAVENDTS